MMYRVPLSLSHDGILMLTAISDIDISVSLKFAVLKFVSYATIARICRSTTVCMIIARSQLKSQACPTSGMPARCDLLSLQGLLENALQEGDCVVQAVLSTTTLQATLKTTTHVTPVYLQGTDRPPHNSHPACFLCLRTDQCSAAG